LAGPTSAYQAVAAAPPDGHTLLLASMGLTTNPHLYSKNRPHPSRDFTAISMLGHVADVLVVNPQLPVRNFEEFLEGYRCCASERSGHDAASRDSWRR
jgi:tripartite-type tricarboxylate transporter receptor subunit TctC